MHGARWPSRWRPLTKKERETSDRYEHRLRPYIVKTPFKTTWTVPRDIVVIALEEARMAPRSGFSLMVEQGRRLMNPRGIVD